MGDRDFPKIVDEAVQRLPSESPLKDKVCMARMAEKLDRPFLICTAADDRITQRGWMNVFRLNPTASVHTHGLEDFFIQHLKPKSMAIIYENSPYGTGAALRMMWFCREQGIDILKIIPYQKKRLRRDYYQHLSRSFINLSLLHIERS